MGLYYIWGRLSHLGLLHLGRLEIQLNYCGNLTINLFKPSTGWDGSSDDKSISECPWLAEELTHDRLTDVNTNQGNPTTPNFYILFLFNMIQSSLQMR